MKGALALVQCGWAFRLGTLMLEAAIVARARILLLPLDHPAAVALALADMIAATSWASMARRITSSFGVSFPPDLGTTV